MSWSLPMPTCPATGLASRLSRFFQDIEGQFLGHKLKSEPFGKEHKPCKLFRIALKKCR